MFRQVVQTLAIKGGEINHGLVAYSLSYTYAKNYQNRLMDIRIITRQVSVVFLDTMNMTRYNS